MGRGGEGREGRNEGCAIAGELREEGRKQRDEVENRGAGKEGGEQVEREQQRRFDTEKLLVSTSMLLRRGFITILLFTELHEVEVRS
jgi:hypothetical protein